MNNIKKFINTQRNFQGHNRVEFKPFCVLASWTSGLKNLLVRIQINWSCKNEFLYQNLDQGQKKGQHHHNPHDDHRVPDWIVWNCSTFQQP